MGLGSGWFGLAAIVLVSKLHAANLAQFKANRRGIGELTLKRSNHGDLEILWQCAVIACQNVQSFDGFLDWREQKSAKVCHNSARFCGRSQSQKKHFRGTCGDLMKTG